MSATTHLGNVYVQKGYNGEPQCKTRSKEGSDKIVATFKVSECRLIKGEKVYDNYSIEMPFASAKQAAILNRPGTRVNLYGVTSIEEFNGTKFVRIRANNVDFVKMGDDTEVETAPVQETAPMAANPF